MSDSKDIHMDRSRREAIKSGAATAAGAAVLATVGRLRAASAAGSDEIRVGLIGCGGRGAGAAGQALRAAKGVKLVAMGDTFKDRLDGTLKHLKEGESGALVDVPADRQFIGFDAYEKVIAQDVNYVIIATPPAFKAPMIKAAIAAGKNVFTEKPMAVDGPTIRMCFEAGAEAKRKNLALGVGLQRHHQKAYLEAMKRIHGGALGEITSGRCYWLQKELWMKPRQPAWTDMEWQMRNWLYFAWLSGDHIVEQHIHNIDVMNWGIGAHPVAAVAMGGRQQRIDPAYGHIYDHFAVDYEYPKDVHVMSLCRQIPGCHNQISEHLVGTQGRFDSTGDGSIKGKKSWTPVAADAKHANLDPYLVEHTDLIESIRKGKPNNEMQYSAESNLAAIMGRISAYTGKRITWEQALESKESLVPAKLAFGKLATPPVAIPGTTDII